MWGSPRESAARDPKTLADMGEKSLSTLLARSEYIKRSYSRDGRWHGGVRLFAVEILLDFEIKLKWNLEGG